MKKTLQLRLCLVINSLLITSVNNAQIPNVSVVEDLLEELVVNNYDEEDLDWGNVLIELSEKMEHPLNLKQVTKADLEAFPFLSHQQIENILAYIYLYGDMKTVSELMLVKEMDKQTIDLLTPFVCVKPVNNYRSLSLKELLKYNRNEFIARLDIPLYKRKGYENRYLGPPIYQSMRYTFSCADKIYIGVTGEKDAGEPFGALHNKKG